MFKRPMLGLLILTVGSTSFGNCDNCNSNETCIDKMCFSRCSDMLGTGSCGCYGDICFDKAWCNVHDEVCCRTCENNWALLIAIIVGLVLTITMAVVYGELCMPGDGELLTESENDQEKNNVVKSLLCCTRFRAQDLGYYVSSSESVLSSVDTLHSANFPNLPEKPEGIKDRPSWSDLIRRTWTKTYPALPRLSENNEKTLVDVETFRLVPVPDLVSIVSHSKHDLSSHRAYDGRLEVPFTNRSKNMSDLSSPSTHHKSNWDCFFETQSTMMWATKRTENIALNNDGNIGDFTDWEKTDIELSHLEFSVDMCGKEDCKTLRCAGSEDSSSTENLPPVNLRQNGEVLLTYYSKGGLRVASVPLDTQLDDIATWLNKDSPYSIPISQNVNLKTLKRERRKKSNKQTLSDIFGGDLNPEKEGITCFIGPVEGRLSFKMSKVDVNMLQRATRDSIASPIGESPTLEFVS